LETILNLFVKSMVISFVLTFGLIIGLMAIIWAMRKSMMQTADYILENQCQDGIIMS
jgi:hypothetical protein